MRMDMFTHQDRIREAIAEYRAHQAHRYFVWTIWGSLTVAVLIAAVLVLIAPDWAMTYRGKFAGLSAGKPIGFSRYDALREAPKSPKPLTLTVIATITLFILSYIFPRLVCLYQGISFGLIVGAISALITWLLCLGLDIGDKHIIPYSVGGLLGILVFIGGLAGMFLPTQD